MINQLTTSAHECKNEIKGDEMEKESEDFLRVISDESSMQILEMFGEGDPVRYKQMQESVNTGTLNRRLRYLLRYGLIQHHLERFEKKVEWYTITERGRKVLHYMRELVKLVKQSTI